VAVAISAAAAAAGTAAVAAVTVVGLGLGLRLADELAPLVASASEADLDLDLDLDSLVPSLVAIALLCVAGLVRRVAPGLVAFALGLAALLGAIEAVAVIRAWLPASSPGERPILVALAGVAGTVATWVSWRFFTMAAPVPRRWAALRTATAVGLVALPFGLAVATATTAPLPDDPDAVTPYRLAARLMLAVSLGALALGAMLVVLPRLGQAWRRTTAPSPIGWVDALVEAFAPGLGRQRAAESERARLAADLHARVVPDLRQALTTAAASSPGSELVVERLRATLGDLETLMVERQSLVLEDFGLVAALEWLAERTQERTGAAIALDLEDEGGAEDVTHEAVEIAPAAEPRPPRAVERAAFRVALLAADNAARHAPGATIAIRVRVGSGAVRVDVSDDGPGFDLEAARSRPSGRRGLADMTTEAAAVGARLEIRATAPGQPADRFADDGGRTGTAVIFEWPAGRAVV
jgi:signal transduction histidine kinase